ncbi:hypothetical protein LR48_Vigan01g146600 [Vigna angularis]|uniref:Uncharacterized protein n=1 Tax=Phaseolus angularis TaxID=3914 RepID=A0A0L9TMX4_PHAAN|nr:hypothetical protein LR48_Vigan01g146600 [Vigna angularis]
MCSSLLHDGASTHIPALFRACCSGGRVCCRCSQCIQALLLEWRRLIDCCCFYLQLDSSHGSVLPEAHCFCCRDISAVIRELLLMEVLNVGKLQLLGCFSSSPHAKSGCGFSLGRVACCCNGEPRAWTCAEAAGSAGRSP